VTGAAIGIITRHWHGPRPWREVVTLGLSHGLYRVGCCWLLMLLMFVVGTGNLGWMLLLGLIMATERNTRGDGASLHRSVALC
jgi:predicted metal-binding membrane protein